MVKHPSPPHCLHPALSAPTPGEPSRVLAAPWGGGGKESANQEPGAGVKASLDVTCLGQETVFLWSLVLWNVENDRFSFKSQSHQDSLESPVICPQGLPRSVSLTMPSLPACGAPSDPAILAWDLCSPNTPSKVSS